jgi:hypothetical protein
MAVGSLRSGVVLVHEPPRGTLARALTELAGRCSLWGADGMP